MARSTTRIQSLYGRDGTRKYLTHAERQRFIAAALSCPRTDVGLLCLFLAFSGCRISEALSVTLSSLDVEGGLVALRSLKKRGQVVFREVPIPRSILRQLYATYSGVPFSRLWSMSRSTAWQLVKGVMAEANIGPGAHATPKGLRHGFGVHAVRSGVPLHLIQRWLGHASLATTAIYLQVIGQEEREIASRMWSDTDDLAVPPSAAARS